MKAARFEYLSPSSAAEAANALAANGDSRLLAGGQSLCPMMNLRLATPAMLIDISRLPELRRIEDRGDHYEIGAAVTHAAIEDATLADGEMLSAVARDIAFRGVRNRGTIGGSVAHADPAADWPTALIALGAELRLLGPGGRRRIPMHRFMLGGFTSALEAGELIEAILVPKLSAGAVWGYHKICRKRGEFADAIGAVVLDPDRGHARVVAGAMNGAPLVLHDLARRVALDGAMGATEEQVGVAVSAAVSDRVAHRLHVVAVKRALARALPA